MRKTLLLAGLLLAARPAPAQEGIICFCGFAWGCGPAEAAARAASLGYLPVRDQTEKSGPVREYEIVFSGVRTRAVFRFSPAGKKLYAVELSWTEGKAPADLEAGLRNRLGEPRKELPGLGIQVWNRGLTEAELRRSPGRVLLIYADMKLWEEARAELKKLPEP